MSGYLAATTRSTTRLLRRRMLGLARVRTRLASWLAALREADGLALPIAVPVAALLTVIALWCCFVVAGWLVQ